MTHRPSRLVLLGNPVAHSLSPRFQNAALRDAGIDAQYTVLLVSLGDLPRVMQELRTERAAGNVTIPYKSDVYTLCDVLTPVAREAGAVNTFWFQDNALHGDNTDIGGFDAAVRALIGAPRHGLHVTLLGAGGSASAVIAAIKRWPAAQLTIWNRTPDRAQTLAQQFDTARIETRLAQAVQDADLVINATPQGLHDDTFPVDPTILPRTTAVFDLVYKLGETAWVRAARQQGHPALDGLRMLVEQGALSFERWFGIPPNRDVMWHSVTTSPVPSATSQPASPT